MAYTHTKQRISHFFDHPTGFWGVGVQVVLFTLVLTSVTFFVLEVGNLVHNEQTLANLRTLEGIIVVIFTAEYLIRLWTANQKRRFVGNFYNVIDLLAILPFYIGFANFAFARILRIGRFVRVFRGLRILKAMRYVTPYSEDDTESMSRILRENISKHVFVIGGLFYMTDPLKEFISKIESELFGDVVLATSIIAVAAMFAFFGLSYEGVKAHKIGDRMFVHLTSGLLLFPIGVMFLVLQETLTSLLTFPPTVFNTTMWLVYAAVILWDFWNVRQIDTTTA